MRARDATLVCKKHVMKKSGRNNKSEPDDAFNNSCVWMFSGALLLALIAGVAIAIPLAIEHNRQTPSLDAMVLMRSARSRMQPGDCTAGEQWDADTQLCAPHFHAPLAFESEIMDGTYSACDRSFYTMMCGRWMQTHQNENRAFSYGFRKTRHRLHKLIAGDGGSDPALHRFYQSCVTRQSPAARRETRIEFRHAVQSIVGSIRTHADLPRIFGRLARAGYTAPLALSMERHPTEARVIPLLVYDGFPEEMMNDRDVFQVLNAAYDTTHYNAAEVQHKILGVLTVARGLREYHQYDLNAVESYRDYVENVLSGHLTTWNELPHDWNVRQHDGEPPMRGWNRFLQELGGPAFRFARDQPVWYPNAHYMSKLLESGIARFTVPEWKAWVEYSVLYDSHQFDPQLPNDVYFRARDHQGPVGAAGGVSHRMARRNTTDAEHDLAERCLQVTQHMLPGLVAESFLNTYMVDRERDRKEVRHIVHGVLLALRDMVRETQWLSAADKRVLTDKLRATIVRVVEPDVWESEPFAASISVDRYDHNLNMIRRYRVERNLALWKPGAPLYWDRNALAFFAAPVTSINAYYSGPSNSITILAGIMQHPFFDHAYGTVSKYAILASVVGHELSHALDNHGLYWGAQGSLHTHGILSAAGMRRFYNESRCVVREYGPAPAGCEDANAHYGNSTMGEDLADLTGIQAAYRALFEHSALGTHGTMGDKQHFFMVLAQAFCESYDQKHRCDAVANDVHAVAEFRIDRTYSNLKQFHGAFQCHSHQGMWRNATCAPYGQR